MAARDRDVDVAGAKVEQLPLLQLHFDVNGTIILQDFNIGKTKIPKILRTNFAKRAHVVLKQTKNSTGTSALLSDIQWDGDAKWQEWDSREAQEEHEVTTLEQYCEAHPELFQDKDRKQNFYEQFYELFLKKTLEPVVKALSRKCVSKFIPIDYSGQSNGIIDEKVIETVKKEASRRKRFSIWRGDKVRKEEQANKANMQEKFILPSFFNLMDWLIENKRRFNIIIRTFGSEDRMKGLAQEINHYFFTHNHFFAGDNDKFKKNQGRFCDERKLGIMYRDHLGSFVCLGHCDRPARAFEWGQEMFSSRHLAKKVQAKQEMFPTWRSERSMRAYSSKSILRLRGAGGSKGNNRNFANSSFSSLKSAHSPSNSNVLEQRMENAKTAELNVELDQAIYESENPVFLVDLVTERRQRTFANPNSSVRGSKSLNNVSGIYLTEEEDDRKGREHYRQKKNAVMVEGELPLYNFFKDCTEKEETLILRDDFPWWEANNCESHAGKPLFVSCSDLDIHPIIFDDNISPCDRDPKIIDVVDVNDNNRKLEFVESFEVFMVASNPLLAIFDEDYFIKKVKLCEENRRHLSAEF